MHEGKTMSIRERIEELNKQIAKLWDSVVKTDNFYEWSIAITELQRKRDTLLSQLVSL